MPCIALHWLSRVILSYPKWLPSGIQPQVTGLKRGEVWWVNLDPTQGSEIQKTRPAVILTVNALNRARRTVVVVPLSSSATPRPPIVVSAPSAGAGSVAVCDQVRAVDKSRLTERIGQISESDLASIGAGIAQVLGLVR